LTAEVTFCNPEKCLNDTHLLVIVVVVVEVVRISGSSWISLWEIYAPFYQNLSENIKDRIY